MADRDPRSVDPRGEPGLSRRQFLVWTGQAALGIAALPIFATCAPSGGNEAGTSRFGTSTVIRMTDNLRWETVTWRNTSSIIHTATDDPNKAGNAENPVLPESARPWDFGILQPGDEWGYTFDSPGEYTYFCIPHESVGMVARLTVTV